MYQLSVVLLIVTLLISILCPSAWAIDTDELWQVLAPYYPIYYEQKDCHGVIAHNGASGGEGDLYQIGYCMNIDRQLRITTANDEFLYVMTTGQIEFDEEGNQAFGAHAYAGLVGMFVLRLIDDKWQIAYADPAINAGFYGKGLTGWKLVKVAPELWGFIHVQSDSHYNTSASQYVLLTPDPTSKDIIKSVIGAQVSFENNPYAPSGCGDESIDYCDWLKARLNIDQDNIVNGFYPLKITVNGHKYSYDGSHKTSYDNERYTLTYEPKVGYRAPKGYPLD